MARPRGYAHWNPKPDSLLIVSQVQEVLDEYREYLPLTARQIFYRLVGAFNYAKTERAYKTLCEKLVRARRAGMIPFSAIRDDGTTELGWAGNGYSSPAAFWEGVRDSASRYFTRRHEGQPLRLEVWCEAAGMAPLLERAAGTYDVKVYSTGGFSSVSVTYEIAQRVIAADVPTELLHVGDYDPSGESIFESMTEDVWAFVVGETRDYDRFHATRLALTREQVDLYGLDTAPPKASDSRSRNWFDETCQLEAMPPDTLSNLVQTAVADRLDLMTRAEVLDRETAERDEIEAKLAEIIDD